MRSRTRRTRSAAKPAVDAFVERNEAQRARSIAEHGWDPQQLRVNYRLLQVGTC